MRVDAARLRPLIAAPPDDIRLYLLFGPDEAGAQAVARQLGLAFGHGAERIDLDGSTLRKDPARLADEAASLSLFGDRRYIRVVAAGEESLEAVAALLRADRAGNPVVALAPGLRATAKLAKLALESPLAYACAFYEPSAAEAEKIAHTLAVDLGLQPEPGIARQVAEASGGDRAVIAQELEKIALYLDAGPERPRPLAHATLEAIGADLGETAQTALIAAIVDGEPAALGTALDRIGGDGASPIPWLRVLARRLLALADMRAAIDGGEPPAAVMKRHRVFFREEAATLAALRRWTPAMLARAVAQVRGAERGVMASANAGPVLAEAAALTIARGIASRR
ncbi:DNA polymerase III subunit delta [Sphingomonas bacterium]|uniref:DNA polymerase III subunit delta n=1 Tax=Sphingomonas bacterium TaxID=1895847 RepID=UPI001576103B|nr:DNA polymerase III subunit delta [Sphingomonas bacterium]